MTPSGIAQAYSASGAAWQAGPARIYDKLADELVAASPVDLVGALVLDAGAGTGAATRAVQRRGARVVALDVALGMLAVGAAGRPPAVAGDVLSLPFPDAAFNAVVAAFSFNHLHDPGAAFREAVRVLRPGGALIVGVYAADDGHPAKVATETELARRGWRPPRWYEEVRDETVPRLATVPSALSVAADAGLTGARAAQLRVSLPELGAEDLVEWRLGLAQTAPFVASLSARDRAALVSDARHRLGPSFPPLERSLVVLTYCRDDVNSRVTRARVSS